MSIAGMTRKMQSQSKMFCLSGLVDADAFYHLVKISGLDGLVGALGFATFPLRFQGDLDEFLFWTSKRRAKRGLR